MRFDRQHTVLQQVCKERGQNRRGGKSVLTYFKRHASVHKSAHCQGPCSVCCFCSFWCPFRMPVLRTVFHLQHRFVLAHEDRLRTCFVASSHAATTQNVRVERQQIAQEEPIRDVLQKVTLWPRDGEYEDLGRPSIEIAALEPRCLRLETKARGFVRILPHGVVKHFFTGNCFDRNSRRLIRVCARWWKRPVNEDE